MRVEARAKETQRDCTRCSRGEGVCACVHACVRACVRGCDCVPGGDSACLAAFLGGSSNQLVASPPVFADKNKSDGEARMRACVERLVASVKDCIYCRRDTTTLKRY